MNIIIEKLKKEDLKEAIAIYDENHECVTDYEKLLSVYDDIYNNVAYHNVVAKIEGKIVGLVTMIINYDIVEDLKPFLTVWNFGVHKNYRRKKVGATLNEYIMKFAEEHNCSFVALLAEKDNKVAQSFYESLDYDKNIGYIKMLDK